MPHVDGVGKYWHMNKPIINNKSGGDLFADVLALFYTVEAQNDVAYNIVENWTTTAVEGLQTYRFDSLPERTETRYLPENYELSRIAGVVRIAGAAGNDTIYVNARSSEVGNPLTADIETKTVSLGDYYFEGDPMREDDVLAAQLRIENGSSTDLAADQAIVDDALEDQREWQKSSFVTINGNEILHSDLQSALFRAHKS